MNLLKEQKKLRNANGFYSMCLGFFSVFLHQFFILQILAIIFSVRGFKAAKINPMLSKSQAYIGSILGILYLILAIVKLFIKV